MISAEQLEDCTQNCCPGCGSCSGMYTANSMNCLCEAIGIGLPGNGTIPAVYSKRLQPGPPGRRRHHGDGPPEHLRTGHHQRPQSIRNALTCDMALGRSTNTVLAPAGHRPGGGLPGGPGPVQRDQREDPQPVPPGPAGPTHMPDLYAAGGIPAVQAELAKRGLLDLDCLTVTGKTVGENIQGSRTSTTTPSGPSRIPTPPPADCRSSGAIWPPTVAW